MRYRLYYESISHLITRFKISKSKSKLLYFTLAHLRLLMNYCTFKSWKTLKSKNVQRTLTYKRYLTTIAQPQRCFKH